MSLLIGQRTLGKLSARPASAFKQSFGDVQSPCAGGRLAEQQQGLTEGLCSGWGYAVCLGLH